jgi:hypothetical protein
VAYRDLLFSWTTGQRAQRTSGLCNWVHGWTGSSRRLEVAFPYRRATCHRLGLLYLDFRITPKRLGSSMPTKKPSSCNACLIPHPLERREIGILRLSKCCSRTPQHTHLQYTGSLTALVDSVSVMPCPPSSINLVSPPPRYPS